MLVALVLALATPSADPAPAAPPSGARKILVLPVSNVGADAEIAKTITSLLTVSLSHRPDLEVLSVDDARALVDAEASKQLLGGACSDTSCLAELAGAMGADLVAYGEVAQLEKTLVITLNVFDGKAAKAAGRDSVRTTSRAELPDLIEASVKKLLPSAGAGGASANTVIDEGGSALHGVLLWGGVGVVALGAVGATTVGVLDASALDTLTSASSTTAEKDAALASRPLYPVLFLAGVGTTVVGAGLLASSFIVE